MNKQTASDQKPAIRQSSQKPFIQMPRSAGILLHVTSLPSRFGIGDFGSQAYAFADFLYRSHQTVWQILPLNSSTSAQGFSPYGSDGTFAGNTLLISPEQLATDGWLAEKDLLRYEVKGNKKTDYEKAQKAKTALLGIAYANYQLSASSKDECNAFCKTENDWLAGYALYIVLKQQHENKSWNQWEKKYKDCDAQVLKTFVREHKAELDKIKWQQWIFHKQWYALKNYCNNTGIKILGDLPFYVAYDSVDVWMNKNLFNLDKNGNMLSESGAPPDDFNADGQRWGMPVYRWDAIKKQGYQWWMNRIKKNMAMYDLLRLDHFRGFVAYWDIKRDAKSAKEGAWKPAPGIEFFALLQNKIGSLPLVAEDLGSIDEPVLQLRDAFKIPGMVIQQVSFGDDMPQSKSIPHHHHQNSIVYTGNHDNNTTLGWFKSLSPKFKKNVSLYTGKKAKEEHVCDVLEHLVYASVAKLTILPMQDILRLDADTRMNSVPDGGASWSWRMPAKALTKKVENRLQELCFLYDRKRKETN